MSDNWFERNPKKTILSIWLLILLGVEVSVRILAAAGAVQIVYFPTEDATKRFYGDINPDFGVWHYPNRTTRHRSPCFDVSYSSNSVGARDVERSLESDAEHRSIVLGDSFVEGVGVNADDRMTNIVEKLTGIEQLNFGTSGDFGSTQEWLLYEKLASKFEHSEVAVYLLPDNDFSDNDPKNFSTKRYRPYLRDSADSDDLELYYPIAFENRERPKRLGVFKKLRRHLYNAVYSLNVIRRIGQIYNHSSTSAKKGNTGELLSSYDRFNDVDLERLLYAYRQIIHLAGRRPVTIFIVPRMGEFIKLEKAGYKFKIVEELQKFAAEFDTVEVIDLLPEFQKIIEKRGLRAKRLFLACDGHWSVLGNRIAAEIVAKKLYGHKPAEARFALDSVGLGSAKAL